MVNSVDIYYSLFYARFYRKRVNGDFDISRHFDWLSDGVNDLNQHSIFDTTSTINTSAGYLIDGRPVLFLASPVFHTKPFNPQPENIELYFSAITEEETTGSEWSTFYLDKIWLLESKTQEDRELILKEVLEEDDLFKNAVTGFNGKKYPCVSWNASVSKNYELYLKYLNACRYKDSSGESSEQRYTITWDKYRDFVNYDSGGGIIDEGYGIYQESGIGFNETIDKVTNAYGDLNTYETYLEITVTPSSDYFIQKVNAVYKRRLFVYSGAPTEIDHFIESYNLPFDVSEGAVTLELRVQQDYEANPEVGHIYSHTYSLARIADEFIEFPSIEFLMDKLGYND